MDLEMSNKIHVFTTHLCVAPITSSIWAYLFVFARRLPTGTARIRTPFNGTLVLRANFYGCGNTVETARAAGCKYDILNNHWVPSQCLDEIAIQEYQADGSWHAFADVNRTIPLGVESMGDQGVYWTNERDHVVHCAVLWRKQFRKFSDGRAYLDSLIVDQHHTNHCSEYLVKMSKSGGELRNIPLEVVVGFASCHVKE
jgi:hypothetical protein